MGLIQLIQELLTLEDIERAEKQYERTYGRPPCALSTWNPSQYYRDTYLMNRVILPPYMELIDYIYPYELDAGLSAACCKKLAGTENAGIIYTSSGTTSISLVTSVLAAMELHRILIVSPTYFAVFHNCIQKQMDIHETHMIRNENGYSLPQESILQMLTDTDILWLTNPIYNTGVYLSQADYDFLTETVLPHTYVVADECFCKSGEELCRKLHKNPHFIGIYDPMKQFLINGAKFSAIVFSPELDDLFCQWSDVVCGGLEISNVQAMKFFVSTNADKLLQTLRQEDEFIQEEVRMIVSKYANVSLDTCAAGHMMMCYLPHLPCDYLHTFQDFYRFQEKTGASIIPGSRFHFPNQSGFAFRINLAQYDPLRFGGALNHTLAYLTGD